MPSDRLRPPLDSPFAKASTAATPFAAQYANGGIPCRIDHGGVRHKLVRFNSAEAQRITRCFRIVRLLH